MLDWNFCPFRHTTYYAEPARWPQRHSDGEAGGCGRRRKLYALTDEGRDVPSGGETRREIAPPHDARGAVVKIFRGGDTVTDQ